MRKLTKAANSFFNKKDHSEQLQAAAAALSPSHLLVLMLVSARHLAMVNRRRWRRTVKWPFYELYQGERSADAESYLHVTVLAS